MNITAENKDIVAKIVNNILLMWVGDISKSYYRISDIENLIFDELKTTKEELESIGIDIKDFVPEDEDFDFKSHFDCEEDEWDHLYEVDGQYE